MQTQITKGVIHVYGHASAEPELVAKSFGGVFAQEVHSDSDLAIFAINPSAGVDQETISRWAELDEFQIPRLVVVTHLEKQEADFDDAVMIANRVFSAMATPYLVLHDEAGLPIALISLADLSIVESRKPPQRLDPALDSRAIVPSKRSLKAKTQMARVPIKKSPCG